MYNYEYVTREQSQPVKNNLIEIINEVQILVKSDFTFRFDFVGSSSRNMITCDFSQNIGFDFDVNIEVNDRNDVFSAKGIKEKLMGAFNKIINKNTNYNIDFFNYYSNCENSTRVFTIKVKDQQNSRIIHSADFCIVNHYEVDGEEFEEYIRYIKKNDVYVWNRQSDGFKNLDERIDLIKSNNRWNDVRVLYLEKKNYNVDKDKKSRSLFAEAVKEVCDRLN